MLKQTFIFLFFPILLLGTSVQSVLGQCSQAKFILPDTLCSGTSFSLIDSSFGLVSQEWDFYANDIASGISSSSTNLGGSSFINNSYGFSFQEENNLLYGFAVNGSSKTITKVSFLDSITNPNPIYQDLTIGTPLASCLSAIRFHENTGFICDGGNELVRIDFDNGLNNQPTSTSTYTNPPLADFDDPRNLRVIEDNDSIFVFVANTGSQKHLSVLSFGNSLGNPLTFVRKIENLNTVGGIRYADDFDIVKVCDSWIGYLILNSGQITIANFGNSLSNDPVLSLSNIGSASNHRFNQIIQSDGRVFLLIQRENGGIRVYDFGTDGLNVNPTWVQYNGVLGSGNTRGFEVLKYNSTYYVAGLNSSSNELKLNKFDNFNDQSSAIDSSSTIFALPYSSPGRYYVGLSGRDSLNTVYSWMDTIDIVAALNADFTTVGGCIDNAVGFSDLSAGFGLTATAWKWEFGDGDTSNIQNTTHLYSNPGTYPIKLEVTANNGCVTSNYDTLEVSSLRPEFPNFGFSPSIICENTLVSFYDSTVVNLDSVVAHKWFFGDGDSSSIANPSHQYSNAGSYIVSLVVTGVFGCDTIVSKTINVQAGPSPAFFAEEFCAGSSTFFTDSSTTIVPSSIISWKWHFGDGDSSLMQNPSHTYTSSGLYNVNLEIETDSGCVANSQDLVTIEELPVPDFVYTVPCAQSEATFTDGSSGNIIAWEWSNVHNPQDTNQSTTFYFPADGFEDVSLTVTNSSGCIDSITRTIEIFPALLPDFEVAQICIGDTTLFTDITPSFSVIDKTWNFDFFGQTSNQENPIFYYPNTGTYNVSLAVTNAIGCENEITKIVEIRELPTVEASFDNTCKGGVSLLYDVSTTANGFISSQSWEIESTVLTGDTVSYVFDEEGSYPITLDIIDNFNCANDTAFTLSVFPLPEVDFSFSPNYGTAPIDIQFTNESSANAVDFLWDFGNGSVNSIEENPLFNYDQNGIYEITLVASTQEACADSATQSISIIPTDLDIELSDFSIQKVSSPNGSLAYKPSVLLKNVGTRVIFNADLLLSINNETQIAETWEGVLPVGQAILYELTSFAVIENESAVDYICLEAQNVNDNTEENFTNNKICLVQNGSLQTSDLYPNPTTNMVYLDMIMEKEGTAQLAVFDLLGKSIIPSRDLILEKGYNQVSINTSFLQAGKYIVNILYQDELIPFSLLIQNP